MLKTRIHINITVSDLEASIDFYSKVFGTEPSKQKADYANFRLDTPALHLALVHQPNRPKQTVTNGTGQHFGVELFDDAVLADWKSRVTASGVLPHLEEENVTCCYAVADKFWLQDPDGNEWEFWVRHDDEGETLASSSAVAPCCGPAKVETDTENCCPTEITPVSGCCS